MQSRKTSADLWHQKPYYSLDAWCKNTYGRKLYKAALDIGCTCPNRDGTLDTRGCIFCSAGGSGDFAASRQLSVTDQLNQAKALLSSKWTPEPGKPSLIAYFQAYTNTYGDPDRLARVFENLLRNAVSYCYPNSLIEVYGMIDGDNAEILVRNQGKTIPEHQLNNLFEKFYRLDEARSSETGGAGLGLAIAKEIIELHDGTIKAKSQNEYTTFIIRLPRKKEEQ